MRYPQSRTPSSFSPRRYRPYTPPILHRVGALGAFTLYDTIEIGAPPGRVWPILTAFQKESRWINASRVRLLSAPPIGVGSRFHEHVRTGLFWANFDLTCTEWEPNRAFAWKARSFGVWGEHRWHLVDLGGRTRIDDSEEFTGPLPLILMARLIFPLFGVKGIRHRLLEAVKRESETAEPR